jgi:hypothetical protein
MKKHFSCREKKKKKKKKKKKICCSYLPALGADIA